MIKNEHLREEIGKKCKEFVITKWSPTKIAEKFLKIINNEIPENWYINPIENYSHIAFIDE